MLYVASASYVSMGRLLNNGDIISTVRLPTLSAVKAYAAKSRTLRRDIHPGRSNCYDDHRKKSIIFFGQWRTP